MAITDNHFWIVDVEGSGGNPPEIVELAILEINDLALTGKRLHWLVHPRQPIQPIASRIHGLTNADVAHSPTIEDIEDDVLLWIDGAQIIGHNIRVELDIISRYIPNWSPRCAIDTMKLARISRPSMESYGLGKLGDALGHTEKAAKMSGYGHHSALYDVTLTALIFIDLLSEMSIDQRIKALNASDILSPPQMELLL
jgi:DNA polymerase III epsilon subunit-like protein